MASRFPSGERARDLTAPEGPFRVKISRPLSASQTLAVQSELPVRTRLPSGEKATELTPREWALRVKISWPVAASQTFGPRPWCFST